MDDPTDPAGVTQPLQLPDQQPMMAPAQATVAETSHQNHTRTILEVVGAVVAVGAIFFAGIGGFVLGHVSANNRDDRGGMMVGSDRPWGNQQDGNPQDGDRQGGDMMPGQGEQGPGQQGRGPGMMTGPDLEQFLQGLQDMMGGQPGQPAQPGQPGQPGQLPDLQQFLEQLQGMMGGADGGTTSPSTPLAPSAPQQ